MRSDAAIRQRHKRLRAKRAAQQILVDTAAINLASAPDDAGFIFLLQRQRARLHLLDEMLEVSTARRDALRIVPLRDPWEDTAEQIMWRQAESRPVDFPRSTKNDYTPLTLADPHKGRTPKKIVEFEDLTERQKRKAPWREISASEVIEASNARQAKAAVHAEKMRFNLLVREIAKCAKRKRERASTPGAIERARKRTEREQHAAAIAERRAVREAQAQAIASQKAAKKRERLDKAIARLGKQAKPPAIEPVKKVAVLSEKTIQARKATRERTMREARIAQSARQAQGVCNV